MTEAGQSDIIVRAIGLEDRLLVERILIETWDATEFATCGEMKDARDLPGFLAFDNSVPVGLLTFHLTGGVCELLSINALTQWKGIGSGLLAAFETEMRRREVTRVFLVTTNDNVDAIRFYQRRGWRFAALHEGAIDEMRRTLKPSIPMTGEYGIPLRDELVFEWPVIKENV